LNLAGPVQPLGLGVVPEADVVRVQRDQLSGRTGRNCSNGSSVHWGSEHHRVHRLEDQANVPRSKRIKRHTKAPLSVLGYLVETAPTGAEKVGGETWGDRAEVSEDDGTRHGNGRRSGGSV